MFEIIVRLIAIFAVLASIVMIATNHSTDGIEMMLDAIFIQLIAVGERINKL